MPRKTNRSRSHPRTPPPHFPIRLGFGSQSPKARVHGRNPREQRRDRIVEFHAQRKEGHMDFEFLQVLPQPYHHITPDPLPSSLRTSLGSLAHFGCEGFSPWPHVVGGGLRGLFLLFFFLSTTTSQTILKQSHSSNRAHAKTKWAFVEAARSRSSHWSDWPMIKLGPQLLSTSCCMKIQPTLVDPWSEEQRWTLAS
ncbi:L-ascorbate peroxidase [Psidium guajava]|nr:L-ascorbate peroxidase [Psidium guajava]